MRYMPGLERNDKLYGHATGIARGRRANIIVGSVIVVLLIVACIALHANAPAAVDGGMPVALVHDSDGGVHELPLSEDSETTVATSKGKNAVVVEDGMVYVREADCDNQDCVRQGRISAPGQQIICLPHQLWIEVVADGDSVGRMDVNAVPGKDQDASEGENSGESEGGSPGGSAGGIDVISR